MVIIKSHFTDHSPQVTVDCKPSKSLDKLIAEIIGHLSSVVRSKKRTQYARLVRVNNIFHGEKNNIRNHEMAKKKTIRTLC